MRGLIRILEEEACRAMQADLAKAERLENERLEKERIVEGERILEEQRQKKMWKLVVGECLPHNVILCCDTCNYDCQDSHVSPFFQSKISTELWRKSDKKKEEKAATE